MKKTGYTSFALYCRGRRIADRRRTLQGLFAPLLVTAFGATAVLTALLNGGVSSQPLTPVFAETAPETHTMQQPAFHEELVTERLQVIATGYSSTRSQTDETPFITASGSTVHRGVVASNLLPFGTKIRIPELFGRRVFVVKDRLHPRKGERQIDIWFPSTEKAVQFGVRETYIEVIDSPNHSELD